MPKSKIMSLEAANPNPVRAKKAKTRTAPAVTLPLGSFTTPTPSTSTASPTLTTSTAPTTSTMPALTSADTPAPSGLAPSVPADFVAPDMREFSGYRATRSELLVASAVVTDLGKFTSYAVTLGILAPPSASIASAVTLGLEWRAQRTSAEAWAGYTKVQDAIAWKGALVLLDELRPLFQAAVSKDATLATAYPGLTKLFNATNVMTKHAVAAKKRNARAAAAAAKAAAAEALATAQAAAVPTAAPKVITVPVS